MGRSWRIWVGAGLICSGWMANALAHFTSIATFQSGPGAWQLGTIAVGNVDNDPALEIIIPSRNALGLWSLDAYDYDGSRLPGFPYDGLTMPINVSPTLTDVDDDGREEILFTHDGQVVCLNGEDGSILWRSSVSAMNYLPDAGFMATTNGFYLSPAGLFSPTLPATAAFFSEVSSPLVIDADGDGVLEALTAWKIDPDPLTTVQDFNPVVNDYFGQNEWGMTGEVWSGGVVHMNARSGALDFIYHFHQLVEAGLAAGQADGDAAREVYVLNDADSVVAYDRSQPAGFLGKGMLHGQFGQNLRLLSGSYQTGVDLTAADLDGDGLDELLAASSRVDPNWQPSASILEDDGALLWREWHAPVTHPRIHGWFNSAVMFAVNPDNDHRVDVVTFMQAPELDYAYWDGVALRSHPGWPMSFAPRLPTAPVIGDIDGDNVEEFVIGTYDPARNPSEGELLIVSLNGTIKSRENIPGGVKHIPSLADVNNDGAVDVVFRAMDGRVYVRNYHSRANAPVSWATHGGSARRDGKPLRPLRPANAPIVHERSSGEGVNRFSWKTPVSPQEWRIFRRPAGAEGFERVATLPGSAREFVDGDVAQGQLYFYEVEAIFADDAVRSSPFAITADYSWNILENGAFEGDDDSHWDKWFSGSIPWGDMIGSGAARSGKQSMEIRLRGSGNNSSITQFSHYGVPESYLPVTPGKLYSFGGFMKSGGLSAGSDHWLEWDSSRTGENTNARPALPWPNYFTPAIRFESAPSGWIYANRVFTMPNGFPNVQLRHRFRVDAPVSGSVYLDDLFFRKFPATTDAGWRDLLPYGAQWRWATNAPANWFHPSFDAATWAAARAKFGAGGAVQNIRTPLPARLPVYYFRTIFTLDSTDLSDLLLSAFATDEYGGKTYPFKLYLNGTELITSGIEAISGEGNIEKHFDLTPFRSLLRPGENLLAVALTNVWQPTWDNVAFDLRLQGWPRVAGAQPGGEARFIAVRHLANGTVEMQISAPAGTTWALQSSDSSAPFAWRTIQNLTGADAPLTIIDSGQNNRPKPSETRQRFYRLLRL